MKKIHKGFEPSQERYSVQTCTWLCVKAAMNLLTQILWTKKDISDRNKTSVLLCCKWVQKHWILYTSSNVCDCPPLFMAAPALFVNDKLVNKSKNWKRLSLRKLKFTLIFAPTLHPWMDAMIHTCWTKHVLTTGSHTGSKNEALLQHKLHTSPPWRHF